MDKRTAILVTLGISAGVIAVDRGLEAERTRRTADTLATHAPSSSGVSVQERLRARPSLRSRAEAPDWTRAAFMPDQVIVASDDVAALAADYDVTVLRAPGASGYAALSVPEGSDERAFLERLQGDDRVRGAALNGVMRGARGSKSGKSGKSGDEGSDDADDNEKKLRSLQWFLKQAGHPKWKKSSRDWDTYTDPDLSAWVVAVLDSGVAYEDWSDDSGEYTQAPSLASVGIVAPVDLVNGDEHANDDHQHGTHIASVIASAGGSSGAMGVAAGASLMPVKVLDEHNAGTELSLIDGIHHAVDNGAHVINMSLSFTVGYQPSQALQEAIARAHEAGVVMVAAVGNDSAEEVSWPAASHQILAVGSVTLHGNKRELQTSAYSNNSVAVDMVAPGGLIGEDDDGDGFDDGVLGETFALNSPNDLGYWFFAGTSQATAVVSGAAVMLLNAGAEPEQVSLALKYAADKDIHDEDHGHGVHDTVASGLGAGSLDLEGALRAIEDDMPEVREAGSYYAAVQPYVKSYHHGEWIQPRARISVVDQDGEPVEYAEIYGDVSGSQVERFDCWTDRNGVCEVDLDWLECDDSEDPGHAWSWRVQTVVVDDINHPVSSLLYATDGLEVLTAAMRADPELSEGVLAIHWPEGDDDELGELVEFYSVGNHGTGLSTSPITMAFTPAAVAGWGTARDISVDLDGTGLSSSPLGFASFRVLDLNGSGLSSSPLGFSGMRLITLDGSGLSSSPLGFHGLHLSQHMDGTGLSSSPLGFSSDPVLMDSGRSPWIDLSGSHLGAQVDEGGWSVGGMSGASAMAASGLGVELELSDDDPAGMSEEGVVLDWDDFAELEVPDE